MVGMALPKSWQCDSVTESPHIMADRKEAGRGDRDRQRDRKTMRQWDEGPGIIFKGLPLETYF